MDSPSAQLVEQSMLDCNGPPSSPFVTEVDAHSRSPSKQWNSTAYAIADEQAATVSKVPQGNIVNVHHLHEDDKENVPQQDSTLARMFASPTKKATTTTSTTSTPEPTTTASPSKSILGSSSRDVDMMHPPPSTRKVSGSARKTPTRAVGSRTPKFLSRGNSFEQTPSQHVSTFQAGLDVRNAAMLLEDQREADETSYSAFSEIPDMTTFAMLGQSPSKRSEILFHTPRKRGEPTSRTSRKRSSLSRSPSPTPRRAKAPAFGSKDETTSFLIDFTQQMEGVQGYRGLSPAKSVTESNLLQYINNQRSPGKTSPLKHHTVSTPVKANSLLNLLDFELPPAPTPRSVPTITVRELESLKSSYLSQISSLKATLSGREAEVDSLKKAVGDAERRVGEAQEVLREEKCKREHAEQEIAGWKKRGEEFEIVLKSIREEVLKSDVEKEEVTKRVEELEKRAEDGEARAVKAEERFADALAARASNAEGGEVEEQVQRLVSAQIDAKIEAVSRELHAVYKEKHERKVATLKKSYEARNEKKTAELQSRVADLEKANDELQVAKDATFSGPVSDSMLTTADNVELKAAIEEHKAALARMESEMAASKSQQDQLMRELQQERIEKGDLVAAVDEMLALQSEAPPTPSGARAMSAVQDFRKSITRPPSGLRAPGSAIGGSEGKRGIPTPGLNRSGSGAGKSRMLANIERMGLRGQGGTD